MVTVLMLAGFVGCEHAEETVIRMERSTHAVAGADDDFQEIVAPEYSPEETVSEMVTEAGGESSDRPVSPTPPVSHEPPAEDEPAMSIAIAPDPEEETSTPPAPLPAREPMRECTMESQCRTGETCGYVDGVLQCTIPLTVYSPPVELIPLRESYHAAPREVSLTTALCIVDANCPSGQTCHFVDDIKQCAVPLEVYREPVTTKIYQPPLEAYREPQVLTDITR